MATTTKTIWINDFECTIDIVHHIVQYDPNQCARGQSNRDMVIDEIKLYVPEKLEDILIQEIRDNKK
jgi:hypothetical protein